MTRTPLIHSSNYNRALREYRNGYICCWWDRRSKNWIVYVVDNHGNQISNCLFFGHRDHVNDSNLTYDDFDLYTTY